MVVLARLNFADISYEMLDSVFWTVVEPSLVIINACIPTMRPLVQAAISKFWSKVSTQAQGTWQLDEYPLATDQHSFHTSYKVTGNYKAGPDVETSSGGDELQTPPGANSQVAEDHRRPGSGVVHVKREWSIVY